MMITNRIVMDLQNKMEPMVVKAVQGDIHTRCLEVMLYCNEEEWTVPVGTKVSMRYRKPDGTQGYYDTMPDGSAATEISGNVVSILLAPQMMTVPGSVLTQLEFLNENRILGTGCVLLNVEPNPAAGTVESEDYVNWLSWMKEELRAAVAVGEFTGPQGPVGPQGVPGPAGRTPERGTDYWTEDDRAGIVADVLGALPVWEGGTY